MLIISSGFETAVNLGERLAEFVHKGIGSLIHFLAARISAVPLHDFLSARSERNGAGEVWRDLFDFRVIENHAVGLIA